MRILGLLVLLVLLVPALAGCMQDGPGTPDPTEGPDGTPTRGPTSSPTAGDGEPRWTNPYGFPLHFDGAAAYDLALQQMYEDPQNHSGPRYRIPGTATHAQVAEELHAALEAPMDALGGTVAFQRFTGEDYYGLDLTPVSRYVSDGWCRDGARERVAGLEFSNIIARTDADAVGYIIGAHWDSKRHASGSDEPILAGDDGAGSTAAVVELARAFAQADPGIPLTFVLFDGEDGFEGDDCHPLAGSLYYSQSLSAEEQATVDGLILLDMIGNASATFYKEGNSMRYGQGSDTVESAWLVDHVWATAAAMEVEAFDPGTTSAIYDDHIPFLYEGMYAIDVIRYEGGFAPYWHTTADDHTAIQPEGLEQVGVVIEASLRRAPEPPEATLPLLPASHHAP